MDPVMLKSFFMWCTIINGGLFLFWSIWILAAPELVYQTQRKLVPITKEFYQNVMYSFLGLFKIFFLFFNLVPYIVFLIIT